MLRALRKPGGYPNEKSSRVRDSMDLGSLETVAGCSRILEYSSRLISDVRVRARSEEASGGNSGIGVGFVLLEPQTGRFAAGQPWSLKEDGHGSRDGMLVLSLLGLLGLHADSPALMLVTTRGMWGSSRETLAWREKILRRSEMARLMKLDGGATPINQLLAIRNATHRSGASKDRGHHDE